LKTGTPPPWALYGNGGFEPAPLSMGAMYTWPEELQSHQSGTCCADKLKSL
jgi:hypothetical protein